MAKLVHLHNHTEYSLLDGCMKIKPFVENIGRMGMPAVAITDHGNMYGAVEFYTACQDAGIKPIIGLEAYLAVGSRHDRTPNQKEDHRHLTILAKNYEGYRSLVALTTASFLEGFYYKPRVDMELLEEHSRGLIVLSGCVQSAICRLLLKRDEAGARAIAGRFRELFGDDFYIELQDNGSEEQKKAVESSIKLARKLGIKLVATNDTHYITPEDAIAQQVLLCINTNSALDSPKITFDGEYHLRSEEEMESVFSEVPESLKTTLEIAEKCRLELDLSEYHLPEFQPPDSLSNEEYLRKLCEENARAIYGEVSGEVRERLEYELRVIEKLGFASYYLIVWDFVRFAKERKIPVGPGRGSGAGSLVAYLLGITQIDPLKYGLLFERFLNPERVSPPDFDIDFSEAGRDEVVKYVIEKYGTDYVAPIISFGTLKARQAVRDVGRVMGLPLEVVDRVAKSIPGRPGTTLRKALESLPELRQRCESDPQIRRLMEIAMKLEGISRHTSKHPAGLVIADEPITEYMPLQKNADGSVTTQYEMKSVEMMKLLKVDLLSLANLTIIESTRNLVRETRGEEIDISQVPLDDARTFELLRKAHTKGVFQLDGPGITALVRKLQPENIEDLIAILALYRPGPLGSGMVDKFVACRRGREKPHYIHPCLESILKETYGVIVYQEQVMRIVHELGGFSLAESDIVRRAMGKKQKALMERYHAQFIEGCAQKGINREKAEQIFELLFNFAEYGFNKSHAAAYAFVSYWTAYLKANYPVEYMTALLNSEVGKSEDKLVAYVRECERMGIEVLPPSVNESRSQFSCKNGKIIYGLSAIKNVGFKAGECIIREREKAGPFKSIFDFCCRVPLHTVNKATVEALIKAGAFDCTGAKRSQLFAVVETAMRIGANEQQDRALGRRSLFQMTPQDEGESELPDIPELSEAEILTNEKEAFGYFLIRHPARKYSSAFRIFDSVPIGDLEGLEDGESVLVGGLIVAVKTFETRNSGSTRMARFTIEDTTGRCEGVLFPRQFRNSRSQLKVGNVVLVYGRASHSQDRFSIRASSVVPVSGGIENYIRYITLRVEDEKLGDEVLEKLKDTLIRYPGECAVYLDIIEEKFKRTVVKLDQSFFIRPSLECIEELRELLGEEAVRVCSIFEENQRVA